MNLATNQTPETPSLDLAGKLTIQALCNRCQIAHIEYAAMPLPCLRLLNVRVKHYLNSQWKVGIGTELTISLRLTLRAPL